MTRHSIPSFDIAAKYDVGSASTNGSFMSPAFTSDTIRGNFSQPTDRSLGAPVERGQTSYLDVPQMNYPERSGSQVLRSALTQTLAPSISIKDLTDKGVFQPLTQSELAAARAESAQNHRPSGFAANRFDGTFPHLPATFPANQYERSTLYPFIRTQQLNNFDQTTGGSALDPQINYYRFNGAAREALDTSTNPQANRAGKQTDATCFDCSQRERTRKEQQINYYNLKGASHDALIASGTEQNLNLRAFEKRERLAPDESPTIKIVYEDTKRTLADLNVSPDFRIASDGSVQILNNPETNPFKEIIIEVARGSGYIGLPNDAQQKALGSLTEYLAERIKNTYLKDSSDHVNLKDQQGLLPQESAEHINPAPQPQDSLPPPTQSQTEALNRISGSDSGSMTPSQANDYFPPAEVPPLPNETPNLSALKDLIAGFATRGIAEPYTAVQERGARGFGIGRYALTADSIFGWISGLTDAELSELEEMEVTTADGKKKKIKLPKSTGSMLKKMRDLLKAVKQGREQGGNRGSGNAAGDNADNSEDAEKAIRQLFTDPDTKDLTQLLVNMQGGRVKPTADEITKSLGPELQEIIATDLIYNFAKDSTNAETNKVNIGKVVLAMQLGHLPSATETGAPENTAIMSAAERGYPIALQHAETPDQPVTWNERNGKVVGEPNSYFFSQFRNATYNPNGPARSNNCGPASLAMAAKAFDKAGNNADPEKQIDRARVAMTGRNNYSELTSLTQIATGAKKLGLQTENVSNLNSIDRALDSGKQIVLFGNPAAYGNRLSSNAYSHYNGLHFILVAGKHTDSAGKSSYTVNDPLSRKGSLSISSNEIQRYMRKENSGRTGVAVWA
ncbi:MAG: C39 family peptidase [Candidatus Obscuribacterales bacterium]|nr:C39 family peptidase [Candidatus Obscuribacterales bacterium]